MRSGQKPGGVLRFEVSGHHIWGKWTSTHPEDTPQSVQSHLNGLWKNRDLKLTIFCNFGHVLLKKNVRNARFMHGTKLSIEFIVETIYMAQASKGLKKRHHRQEQSFFRQ